jgi:hypothetical protein
VLTSDDYALRLWTPRPPSTDPVRADTGANPGTGPVDLIARIPPDTFQKHPDWQIRDGAFFKPTPSGALEIAYTPPPDYRVDMELELAGEEASKGLGIGLVIDGRRAEVAIDMLLARDFRTAPGLVVGDRYSGLCGLGGLEVPYGPGCYHGQLLSESRPARLALTVRPGSIHVTCDDVLVVDWAGDPKRIVPNIGFMRTDHPNDLVLALDSPLMIRKMTLTPLPAESR